MRYTFSIVFSIVFLLLSCTSSSPPTTYERGTYRPPAPAPARPGVGAPTYDPHVTPLPPQPQPKPARVLPQTPETRREPTIWASNPGDKPAMMEEVWGFHFQEPGDADEGDARRHIRECKAELDGAANASGWTRERLERSLTATQRECLLASLMSKCLKRRDEIYDDALRGNRLTRHLFPQAGRALQFINAWKFAVCGERGEFITPVPRIANDILARWGRR